MSDIVTIIINFEGIIGALLGVIVTLILTQILKNSGRMRFYPIECEVIYEKTSEDGWSDRVRVENKEDAEYVSVKLKIELFNGSEVPKILRDIRLCFYANKKILLSVVPEDQSTEQYMTHSYWRDKLLHINIMPKQITKIELVKYFNKSETEVIRQSNRLELNMKNHRNRIYKMFISNI